MIVTLESPRPAAPSADLAAQYRNVAADLVGWCAKAMGSSPAAVCEFVVADDAAYSRAVHGLEVAAGRVNPGTYTDNASCYAVAKTASAVDEDGGHNSVLVRVLIVNGAITRARNDPLPEGCYESVITHELGHYADALAPLGNPPPVSKRGRADGSGQHAPARPPAGGTLLDIPAGALERARETGRR